MTKLLLLIIPLVILLTACSRQSTETPGSGEQYTENLTEIIMQLEAENNELLQLSTTQAQELELLQFLIADMERRTQDPSHPIITKSFFSNLYHVAEFIGVPELTVDENNITIAGNIVTAIAYYDDSRIYLILRHGYVNQHTPIWWQLLHFNFRGSSQAPYAGPGMLDAGRSVWQSNQNNIFDESFTMRFVVYNDLMEISEYFYEDIHHSYWQTQVIQHMLNHTQIHIARIWIEGFEQHEEKRLVVDLTPRSAIRFNFGSTGAAMRTRSLLTSLNSLPGVTGIEILIGGQRGVYESHFCFAQASIR